MREVPTLLTEEEFLRELEDAKVHLERRDIQSKANRISYLSGWVSAETAPIFTRISCIEYSNWHKKECSHKPGKARGTRKINQPYCNKLGGRNEDLKDNNRQ